MATIERAAVIGAGVMGSGIAAHIANAGVPVLLLDVPAEHGDRDARAREAVARLRTAQPAPLMAPENAERIAVGNTEDHLDRLADCDWIVEAVVERADIKRDLYRRLDSHRRPGSVVSSNTSTIRLAELTRGLPADFRRNFLITHFFNPPRYMRLVEIVAGDDTWPETVDAITEFLDRDLGKTVIPCFDRPGFVANRIGTYWLQCAVVEAIDAGLTVEEADAVIGRPFGIPKSGVFGLLDLVGLDLMPHVLESLSGALPADDPFHDVCRPLPLLERMIADGYTGRKGRGGFYRLRRDGDRSVKQAIDLETGDYRDAERPNPKTVAAASKGGPRALLAADDRFGRYAWRVMSRTLAYAARVAPEVTARTASVDDAIRLGFNWRRGPFELIDAIGPDWFAAALRRDGQPLPALLETAGGRAFYRIENGVVADLGQDGAYRPVPRPDGVLRLADVKRRSKPLARTPSASLWDIGDGVTCLEFHSKMNAIDPLTLWAIRRAIAVVNRREFRALVLYNEAENFSVGANIGLLPLLTAPRAWFLLGWLVRLGQTTFRKLKYAPFPVVGAPSGMALGGGCEVLLHCDAIEAHAETYAGLVEAGLGLVPAWGGCAAMLERLAADPERPQGPMPPTTAAFETLAMATVARSAAEARRLGFLRRHDGITMNRDRLLAAAKARALAMAEDYRPPAAPAYMLAGRSGRTALELSIAGVRRQGKASAHDARVGSALAEVLSGGDTDLVDRLDETDVMRLERRAFVRLAAMPETQARVIHMLRTGKPLRN